ncbi:hypothetical protein JTB14_016361 [Gonioctena quinquepunctata]|nr:hypothetical protein JTB14_016361 [Gonioctena quinquepunctata]
MKHSVFPKLRDDAITDLIRYDELIITFGNMMSIKYSTSSHHHQMIRYRLRHLGKIPQTAKSSNSEISDMASLFDPKYFDYVTKAIQDMAGLNYQ